MYTSGIKEVLIIPKKKDISSAFRGATGAAHQPGRADKATSEQSGLFQEENVLDVIFPGVLSHQIYPTMLRQAVKNQENCITDSADFGQHRKY